MILVRVHFVGRALRRAWVVVGQFWGLEGSVEEMMSQKMDQEQTHLGQQLALKHLQLEYEQDQQLHLEHHLKAMVPFHHSPSALAPQHFPLFASSQQLLESDLPSWVPQTSDPPYRQPHCHQCRSNTHSYPKDARVLCTDMPQLQQEPEFPMLSSWKQQQL